MHNFAGAIRFESFVELPCPAVGGGVVDGSDSCGVLQGTGSASMSEELGKGRQRAGELQRASRQEHRREAEGLPYAQSVPLRISCSWATLGAAGRAISGRRTC